jgi:DnaJ-class molecular chaperone
LKSVAEERRSQYERIQAKKARGEKLSKSEEAFLNTVKVGADGELTVDEKGGKAYLETMKTMDTKGMNADELQEAAQGVRSVQAEADTKAEASADKITAMTNFAELEKNEKTKKDIPDILSSSKRGTEFKQKMQDAIRRKRFNCYFSIIQRTK